MRSPWNREADYKRIRTALYWLTARTSLRSRSVSGDSRCDIFSFFEVEFNTFF